MVTGLSVGLFVLPVAVAVLWGVALRAPLWPESLGVLAGIAVLCLTVGVLNTPGIACSAIEASRQRASCGGLDPAPWLLAGVVLAVVSVAAYAAGSRKARHEEASGEIR